MYPKKAVYPGTFNPWTIGHQDILERALTIFDEIDVVMATNPKKVVHNLDWLCHTLKPLEEHFKGHVRVVKTKGLVSALKLPIVRGVRSGDWEYEQNMAMWNKKLGVETVFMCPDPALSHINSSAIRLLYSKGEPVKEFIGLPEIAERWLEMMRNY